MRITLFGKKDERRLPRHTLGKARPFTWAEGYSHVGIMQEKVKAINDCPPCWSFEASNEKELAEKLEKVSMVSVGEWDFSGKPKRKYTKRKMKSSEKVFPEVETDTASQDAQVKDD